VFDAFHDIEEKAKSGNAHARRVYCKAGPTRSGSPVVRKCRQSLTVTVFKVPGETNTDDLSPAPDATTRP
jgi:aconitate hydratase 2/2-methylisocitrate dehydratase